MDIQANTFHADLIYDVGAHKGEDTEFYLKKGFRVIAIEANPYLNAELHAKFADEIKSGRLVLVDGAISDTEEPIDFFINETNSLWGTTNPKWADRNSREGAPSRKISVSAHKFETLLKRYGLPRYLKVDIEGADMLCINALCSFPQRPYYISIESNKVSWKGLLNEFNVLKGLGYNKFKVVNQEDVLNQNEPNPSLEGEYTAHKFTENSTGLFGKDLPGRWLSADEAIAIYRLIFISYKLFGDNTLGGRIVRKLLGSNTLGGRIVSCLPMLRRFFLPSWYDTHAALSETDAAASDPLLQ